MASSIVGVNIIETLTTGMYRQPETIFREYIQNSCDAIDVAMKRGILAAGESSIKITIDKDKQYICIEDNGSGISALDFKQTLSNIADSQKTIGTNKGFRGIGRLCGLAYCNELIFISKSQGENFANVMHFDAKKLRDNFYVNSKLSANQVIDDVIEVGNIPTKANLHGFKVEMKGVTNKNLLNVDEIKNYLSFIAPVRYSDDFSKFSSRIYEHAKNIGFKIDEYNITVNNDPIFKNYSTTINFGNSKDSVFDLSFRDFYDSEGNLTAWAWNGLSGLKGIISTKNKYSNNRMRCIRLRKGNIQIGGENAFANDIFPDVRTNHYFIGEIFAVDKELIPNSQRDYFIDHPARIHFEECMKVYFGDLWAVVRKASDVNAAKKSIKRYKDSLEKFERNLQQSSAFTVSVYMNKLKLDILRAEAEKSKAIIDAQIIDANSNTENDLSKVILFLTADEEEISLPEEALSAPPPFYRQVKNISGTNIFSSRAQ